MTTEEWTPRMAEINHTHPHDDPAMRTVFQRGSRPVAADGGRREAAEDDDSPDGSARDRVVDSASRDPTMRDVSHTPPTGDGANDVFQRGQERTPSDGANDAPAGTAGGRPTEDRKDGDDGK